MQIFLNVQYLWENFWLGTMEDMKRNIATEIINIDPEILQQTCQKHAVTSTGRKGPFSASTMRVNNSLRDTVI